MDLRDVYKDQYSREVVRRQELTGSVTIPLGVLSLILGGLFVVVKEISPPIIGTKVALLFALSVTFLICCAAIYFLCRCYFHYEYKYMATPQTIQKYLDETIAFHVASGKGSVRAKLIANGEVLEYIDSAFARTTEHNTLMNDRKSGFLHNANVAMILALISGAVVGFIYLPITVGVEKPVPKVEIANLKEFPMSAPTKAQGTNTTPAPVPAPAPPPEQTRPAAPPDRTIREHVEPTRPTAPPDRMLWEHVVPNKPK